MSATLYREGPDLDGLLAELDSTHPGRVRVLDVAYGRDGGMLGFFAKRHVGVTYALDAADDVLPDLVDARHLDAYADAPLDGIALHQDADLPQSPLEALLRAAEAAEMVESGRVPATAPPASRVQDLIEPETGNVEFARMLLDMANRKAAERTAQPPVADTVARPTPPAFLHASPEPVLHRAAVALAPAVALAAAVAPAVALAPAAPARPLPQPADEPSIGPTSADRPSIERQTFPAVTITQSRRADVPARGTDHSLRRQLAEIGVPTSLLPEDDSNLHQVLDQLLRRAPVVGDFTPQPGQVLAIAGPARFALAEARRLCARLRLDEGFVHTAGCGDDPITHPRQAASLGQVIRAEQADPCVVVVATDAGAGADPTGTQDLTWAAAVLAALAPDHLLAVVSATCKPADVRTDLDELGVVSSIAVVGASRTTSPAALWDLGAPIASLDGRPATRGSLAALMIDRLGSLDGV